MSKEAQRVYLTDRMVDHLGDFVFPISIPNQTFNIPTNSPYGEFHIISGPEPVIVGGEGRGKARVRYVGFVQLNIWLPKGSGTRTGTLAEDTFKDIFQFHQGRDDEGSSYKFKAIQSYTPQTKVGWECVVVRVPFQRDSIEDVMVSI